MIIVVVVIFMVTNTFSSWKENNQKLKQQMENKVEMMSQNSLLECFEQVFPVAANLNEEYNKIAKEGDEKEDEYFSKNVANTNFIYERLGRNK